MIKFESIIILLLWLVQLICDLYFLPIPNNSDRRESTISRFDPIENSWEKLGDLNVARAGQGVIQVGNQFIVVGGSRSGKEDEPSESCKLNQKSVVCTTREPTLSNFGWYPELMLIP